MSDAMLHKAVSAGETSTKLSAREQKFGGIMTPFPGDMTPGFSTPAGDIDMKKIGQVQDLFFVFFMV